MIAIDGFTGNVYMGELPLEESVLEKARAGDDAARGETIWQAFETLMAHADEVRRLRVRATPTRPTRRGTPASAAPRGSACAGPSMFLGEERVSSVRKMIFAETEEEEEAIFDELAPLQREDFLGIFRAMDGLPVTVRLLDRRSTSSCPTRSTSRSRWRSRSRVARTSRTRNACCRR